MNNKRLIISSVIAVVTILFVVAYLLFSVFGVTQSRVVRNELTIVTGSSDKLYDGTSLSNDLWYIESGSLYEGDTLETTMGTSITNPSSVDNEIGVTILDSEGKNVTINYKINYKLGKLTVRPIKLTVRTEGNSKYFDGSPLMHQVWSMQFGELLDGHRLEYAMNSTITAPGTIDNEVDITILDESDDVVNHIYDITYNLGSLTVYGRDITISTDTYEKGYDGDPLLGGSVTQTGELALSNTIVFGPQQKLTNPGTLSNERSVIIYDSERNDVTEFYNITYDFGTLTVYPIELSIRSDSATKVYDGTPLSNDQWELVHGQVLDGHVLVVDVDNQITEVGIIDNTIRATILDESGADVSYIYNIEYITGTLEVISRDLIISTVSDSKLFDRTPLTSDGYTIEMGKLSDNHRIEYLMASSITNPGEIDNEITLIILNENDEIVTSEYNIEYMLGTLKVLAKEITISTETLDKVYDGTPLLGGTGTLIFGELTEGHTIDYGPGDSIVEPGSKSNEIEAIIYDSDGNDMTIGYDITYEYGTLTIHAISLIVKSPDDSKTYDGTPLSNNTWELINGTLVEGHELFVYVDNSITDVGSIKNIMIPYVINDTGNDVSDMYDIEQLTGTLIVHPIEITIATETLEKGYDGTPLLGGSGTLQFGSLLNGHVIEYGPEQSITNPGSITNTVDVRVFDGEGKDVTEGYAITHNYGTLTISPVSIIVKSPDDTKIYDGTPLSNNTWELISGTLLDNHTLIVQVDNEITYPGSVLNTMDAFVTDEVGNDVSYMYDIEHITGRLTVTGIDITIQTDDYDKPYDGTALLGGIGTIVAGTLDEDHTVYYGPEQSITNPGSVQNSIDITILDGSGNDVTIGYNITESFGTLTIDKITIILKSPDATKIYDGTPLSANTYQVLNGSVLAGHTLYVDVDNEITDVGSIDNAMFAYVLDGSGNSVTHYYSFLYNLGTLTVLSSAYSSSEIATESFDIPQQDVFRVYAGISGLVYFKDRAHGDYNHTGWTAGVVQNTSITNNPLSFPSTALAESGRASTQISVEYLRDQVPYLSPYYTADTISGLNDIHITGDTSITSNINIIMYNFNETDGITIQDVLLSSEEQTYRTYVYANYLDIPADTLAEMLLIAQANGLSAASPTIIADVQNYIQNAATYNLDFASIPEGEDVAVYFLNVSKEGICQHYATAATLMYRALGVPARYVTGFVGNLDANQWTTVDSKQAHAWVEVYIDGLGWVPVEVTGTGSEVVPINPIEITVIPNTVRELYEDGKTITASSLTILGYTDFFIDGYTYQATYGGSLSTIGIESSTVSSMTIYDSEGKDVTNQFAITFMEGELQLYGYEIELVTSNDTKIYDGTPLTNTTYIINGSLATNHHVESVDFTGSQTNSGVSENIATIIIHDENDNDVTSLYSVDYTYGDLTVTPRSITIESANATKTFDGTPLTNDTYVVTNGFLVSTDTIEIDITGSQTTIGKSMNTISSITVLSNGNDVTSNYIIVTVEGELVVTPY